MSTETSTDSRGISAAVVMQYLILAAILVMAFAGAFTHMHDWTIASLDEALKQNGSEKRTAGWIGWANAVISELLPVSSFLSLRQRQQQGRPTGVPTAIFLGSACVSLMAQLSATGIPIPGAAQFLACLPALAVLVLSKVIFSDVEYADQERKAAAVEAERRAELERVERRRATELAAERRQVEAERAAELSARREREAAELAAELKRAEVAQAAELRQAEARIAAEAELQRVRAEAERAAEVARIEAAERQAEREAAERRERREADARQAAAIEAARIAAEAEATRQAELARAEAAERIAAAKQAEADAEARKAAAERLATMTANAAAATRSAGAGDDEERQRRPRAETAALVEAVLATLEPGTERPAAVLAVAEQLGVTREYARSFVPAGYVAGSSAAAPASSSGEGGSQVPSQRHLTVA